MNLICFKKKEIARSLRPQTLRALFGLDKIRNAVHCTDLPEDAILEVSKKIIRLSFNNFILKNFNCFHFLNFFRLNTFLEYLINEFFRNKMCFFFHNA